MSLLRDYARRDVRLTSELFELMLRQRREVRRRQLRRLAGRVALAAAYLLVSAGIVVFLVLQIVEAVRASK